jgi:peptidyl-prolyl cis-trans isomerase B (cyclophilin B)
MSSKLAVEKHVADVDFDTKQYEICFRTNFGDIRLKLDPQKAPEHSRNMIGLVRSGFYDNLTFHRIIADFMIQGGCPKGNGTGGPGFQVDAEFNDTPHDEGVLSMARSSDPNSAGSQFFICLARHPHLDGKYTAFGRTADEESLQVVREIGAVPTDANDRPKKVVKIESATVLERDK